MRTPPHILPEKKWYYEQLAQTYKRPLPEIGTKLSIKDELESCEETDTEKQFKKVNASGTSGSIRDLQGNSVEMIIEGDASDDSKDQRHKYRKAYEVEKLRYCEERSKYFY